MNLDAIPKLYPALPDAALEAQGGVAAGASANEGGPRTFASFLSDAVAGAGSALDRADGAERAFAAGRGGLQEMVLERAQADVALSIASAAASRTAQALSTILGMQI
jgi:flagellar hook-basal body complex protein FliE